ncbi:MAG: YjbQ family protein [Promethearchaeota archaeon]
MERLYQPDFSCIFGKEYADAFIYGKIDSLVWPIFTDIEKSDLLKNLLKLKNLQGREYFYIRKISSEDFLVEMDCSDIDIFLFQAMDLGRSYGISNEDVIKAVKAFPKRSRGILSFNPLNNSLEKEKIISSLQDIEKEIEIAGIVLYPTLLNLNLNDNNESLDKLLEYCSDKNYFVKIDLGNNFLPYNNADLCDFKKLHTFFSHHPNNIFIISNIDVFGDFHLYYMLLKYFNNVWIEIDPRTFGGSTPRKCFESLFQIPGFIQNTWWRICIGSATPTLEISQMVRGFLEASEKLTFAQMNILRTWSFRNINRLNLKIFKPIQDIDISKPKTLIEINDKKVIETKCEIEIIKTIKMRSYSITQLIYLTDIIKEQINLILKNYPEYNNGELFLRSYHTTTSLIINEHEFGNYLDLHYLFAEISKQDTSPFLHTVRALENRADFNHFDHRLAVDFGNRQLNIPIINRRLELGGRENIYILVTFGPRTFNLLFKIVLKKEN